MAKEAAKRLQSDPKFGPIIDQHRPLRLDPSDDLFQRLIISILRQQVSMASASATRERLFEAVEITPEGILETEEQTLKDVGLSQQKARYVCNVSETFLDGGYDKPHFEGDSNEEIIEALTDITGVGPWTARMQLLFTFGRPDVFPVGDLGIRKGIQRVFEDNLDQAEMCDRADRWSPYRSYASLYLWYITD